MQAVREDHTMEKSRYGRSSWFVGGVTLLMTIAAAAGQAAPLDTDMAVAALSRLSAADLDTARPNGKAYLASIFADPAQSCSEPNSANPNFDKLCFWSADPDSEWPDLMIGMLGTKIVSVVTPYNKLDEGVWSCRPAFEGGEVEADDIKLCFVRTVDQQKQDDWTKSWQAFLNAAN